jgi:hypothetical protein
MQQNMGSADSFIRSMIGIAFLVNIIILEPGAVGTIILFALGAVNIATAWIKYCPAYTPFGICTCPGCGCSKTEKSE